MITNRVMAVGFVVGEDVDAKGRLDLRCWVRYVGAQGSEFTSYTGLTFTELCDVVLAHLDENRPGYEVGFGWSQPPILGFEEA